MARRLRSQRAPKRLDVRKYRGQWVALDPRTFQVVGHGHSLIAAERQATAKGVMRPVMYGVPKSDGFFVGLDVA
jgi:hypothetical protein